MEVFTEAELLVNITKHSLVPSHRILSTVRCLRDLAWKILMGRSFLFEIEGNAGNRGRC
jgi:hypothetical protein